MNWKDPKKELPEDGQMVAVIMYHNKQHWPMSVEIFFGEVSSYINEDGIRIARAETNDFTGNGSVSYYLSELIGINEDVAAAWCDAKEFQKPDFITHDSSWGKCTTEVPERKG